MAAKPVVVLTGASGTIASLVIDALRERYELRALDLRQGDGIEACDLLGPREAIRPFFEGADAVVHMGFVPPPSGTSSATTGPGHDSDGGSSADGANDALFGAEHANVEMAFNVFQTAAEAGVRRVVMASSNHAADYYEDLILDHSAQPCPTHMPSIQCTTPATVSVDAAGACPQRWTWWTRRAWRAPTTTMAGPRSPTRTSASCSPPARCTAAQSSPTFRSGSGVRGRRTCVAWRWGI